MMAKKYFGKYLHILFSKPEIKQETWLHLKDLELWYSDKLKKKENSKTSLGHQSFLR